jgi:hypothetical protein
MDSCVIIETPTNLGLHPDGGEKHSGALLQAGSGEACMAPLEILLPL